MNGGAVNRGSTGRRGRRGKRQDGEERQDGDHANSTDTRDAALCLACGRQRLECESCYTSLSEG